MHYIDEFSKLRTIDDLRDLDVKLLRDIPERKVKEWVAEIIGEKNVPKDWAGENSDLYTTRVHIEGKGLRAAFTFKGPAVFRPLHPGDCGKNGDQIQRLFNEPAELFVLQHCHYITAGVLHTLEAFASSANPTKRFTVLDGIDTLRLLIAYKKVKTPKRKRRRG